MACVLPLIQVCSVGCNLRCSYCYYNSQCQSSRVMGADVLETVIVQLLALGQKTTHFCWHGGEPTLAGTEFFERACKIQKRNLAPGQRVVNSIQTNGIVLNEGWMELFEQHGFQIGISLDGPATLHDSYRRDGNGEGTHSRVMDRVSLLQRYGFPFGVICVLTDKNVMDPAGLTDYFYENGIRTVNFGLAVAYNERGQLESYSITPDQLANFMIGLYKKWIEIDDPTFRIPRLDEYIRGVINRPTRTCEFNDWCNHFLMFDYDGTVRSCCSLPLDWVLGNLMEQPLQEILRSKAMHEIKRRITQARRMCKGCAWQTACNGGCAGYSFLRVDTHGCERNYFCSAHRRIYSYLREDKHIQKMILRLRN